MSDYIDERRITLADVKLAIRILKIYLRYSREAERLVRYMSRMGYPSSERDLITQLVMSRYMGSREQQEEHEEEEVSDEELERLRSIAEKYKPRGEGSGEDKG